MSVPFRKGKVYYCKCTDLPDAGDEAAELAAAIERAVEIDRPTFLRHVNRTSFAALEAALGYGPGLLMARDRHVRYHRTRYAGWPCVYLVHSAIEYLFVEERHYMRAAAGR